MRKFKMKKKMLSLTLFATTFSMAMCGMVWASSGGGEVHNSWLKVDTWKLLNFTVLVVALFFIVRKPVANFFSSRADGIKDEINELEQKKAEAKKKLAEYQEKFKNLDQESKQIVKDYIQQGEEAKQRILAQAEEQAEKLEDMAKRNIQQEFKAAKSKLQQEIVEKALEKAEQIIKASISSDDQDKLVDEYLKKVVA